MGMASTEQSSYMLLKTEIINLEKQIEKYYLLKKKIFTAFSKDEINKSIKEEIKMILEHINYIID